MRLARSLPTLAVAALIAAPSSAAEVDVRAVAGMPQVAPSAGRALAWRNVGVVAEGELVDFEARVAACSTVAATAGSGDRGVAAPACPAGFASGAGGIPGHRLGATLKVPRWHDDAPLVDLAVRHWRSPLRTTAREPAAGSAATVSATHLVGPADAFYGYSVPIGPTRAPDQWHSAFAGVAWHADSGATIEFVADRAREPASGAIDRTFTLRYVLPPAIRGLRASAYATRAPDGAAAGSTRAGVAIDYAF